MAVVAHKTVFSIHGTYYRAVGEVIVRCALFEHFTMVAIGAILGFQDPKKMRVSFMGMNAKARLGTLRELTRRWVEPGKLQNELFQIVKAGRVLMSIRNQFAHGIWGFAEPLGKTAKTLPKQLTIGYVKEREFYLMKSAKWSRKKIAGVALNAAELNKRTWDAITELKALHASSPQKP